MTRCELQALIILKQHYEKSEELQAKWKRDKLEAAGSAGRKVSEFNSEVRLYTTNRKNPASPSHRTEPKHALIQRSPLFHEPDSFPEGDCHSDLSYFQHLQHHYDLRRVIVSSYKVDLSLESFSNISNVVSPFKLIVFLSSTSASQPFCPFPVSNLNTDLLSSTDEV